MKAIFTIVVATLVAGCAKRSVHPRPATAPSVESWLEVARWPDGALRHLVVEDVFPLDRSCEPTLRRHHHFDGDGLLVRRETEYIRCGVVEARMVEIVPQPALKLGAQRRFYLDEDRDGRQEPASPLTGRATSSAAAHHGARPPNDRDRSSSM